MVSIILNPIGRDLGAAFALTFYIFLRDLHTVVRGSPPFTHLSPPLHSRFHPRSWLHMAVLLTRAIRVFVLIEKFTGDDVNAELLSLCGQMAADRRHCCRLCRRPLQDDRRRQLERRLVCYRRLRQGFARSSPHSHGAVVNV